ncbi:hypothetical protein VTK26DRAFT_4903 [Humicola hyalothermophila]
MDRHPRPCTISPNRKRLRCPECGPNAQFGCCPKVLNQAAFLFKNNGTNWRHAKSTRPSSRHLTFPPLSHSVERCATSISSSTAAAAKPNPSLSSVPTAREPISSATPSKLDRSSTPSTIAQTTWSRRTRRQQLIAVRGRSRDGRRRWMGTRGKREEKIRTRRLASRETKDGEGQC